MHSFDAAQIVDRVARRIIDVAEERVSIFVQRCWDQSATVGIVERVLTGICMCLLEVRSMESVGGVPAYQTIAQ